MAWLNSTGCDAFGTPNAALTTAAAPCDELLAYPWAAEPNCGLDDDDDSFCWELKLYVGAAVEMDPELDIGEVPVVLAAGTTKKQINKIVFLKKSMFMYA